MPQLDGCVTTHYTDTPKSMPPQDDWHEYAFLYRDQFVSTARLPPHELWREFMDFCWDRDIGCGDRAEEYIYVLRDGRLHLEMVYQEHSDDQQERLFLKRWLDLPGPVSLTHLFIMDV